MRSFYIYSFTIFCLFAAFLPAVFGQPGRPLPRSQEISEDEGIPVLIKHLPEWEKKRDSVVFVTKGDDLRTFLDDRPVFSAIEFIPGTEAVIASYPAGKLLIVEYGTPQASVDTDRKILRVLAESESSANVFYRRIGNYNVLLFDGSDKAAADALFEQIKYEKVVHWLDMDPTVFLRREREFIVGTTSLFISTVIVIVTGLGTSTILGVIAGIAFFFFREHKRSTMTEFSDAGGLTRLNLDGLTPSVSDRRRFKQ